MVCSNLPLHRPGECPRLTARDVLRWFRGPRAETYPRPTGWYLLPRRCPRPRYWGRNWPHCRWELRSCLGLIGPCCRRLGSVRLRQQGRLSPTSTLRYARGAETSDLQRSGVGNDLTVYSLRTVSAGRRLPLVIVTQKVVASQQVGGYTVAAGCRKLSNSHHYHRNARPEHRVAAWRHSRLLTRYGRP
jgi:hypothetical protein